MQAYPEVPQWWFAVVGIASIILLGVAIEIFPTQLPFWGMLVAILISALFSIPSAIILAMTNVTVYLNVISEVLAGYMFKEKPVANMIFKSIGVMVSSQASTYAGDMKLGHYMKIPPRVMFSAQVVAVIMTCFVTNAVQDLMFAHIPDLCSPHQKDGFTCTSTTTFATSSLVWGEIGPQWLFNHGGM
jgi:OPT family oligopeptide transporter